MPHGVPKNVKLCWPAHEDSDRHESLAQVGRVSEKRGIEVLHWSEVGMAFAPDSSLMSWAAEHGFIVLTNDLDFGIALATANTEKPSVVQIRGDDLRPASIGNQVVQALRQMQAELAEGALVTIDPKRTRLRLLPLRKNK
jgi:predicted nuclease of predicted toxin-antitoxin system